jgi:hypothetical protein
MTDRKQEPRDPKQNDLVEDQEFDSLLKEMQETFGVDDDEEDTEDLEETGEIEPDDLGGEPEVEIDDGASRSVGFHVDSGMVERLDDVVLDFAARSLDPDDAPQEELTPPPPPPPPPPPSASPEPVQEPAAEQAAASPPPEPTYITDDVSLSVRFSAHAATGGGSFRDTEAKGLLMGQRSYPIVMLDDFTFGFNAKRNEYEIILDPTATESTLKDLTAQGDFTVMCDEYGEIWILKPLGIRLDLYKIERLPTGERHMQQIKTSEADTMEPVWLPTDPIERFDRYTEFMLGVGLTEEASLCYAFSLYIAVGLSRPKSDSGS